MEALDRDVTTLTEVELNRKTEVMSKVNTFTHTGYRLAAGKSTSNNSHEVQLRQVHNAIDFSAASSAGVGRSTEHSNSTEREAGEEPRP